MKLSMKIYKNKVFNYYFDIDGYDYRDDKLLTYQEAVLIDYILKNPGLTTIDTDDLDNIGVRADIWWKECIARFFSYTIFDTPWNKVLKDKHIYYLKDTKYDEQGNRIPWQELEPYKEILNLEKTMLKR